MLFQIIQPYVTDIYGDSLKEAIKNYVKFNHNLNVTNLIIKDQANHYETRLRYYTENNKNKVGFDVYPYTNVNYPLISPIGPVITPAGPIINSNIPVTFVPSNPLITTQNSPFMANNNTVFVRNPRFY